MVLFFSITLRFNMAMKSSPTARIWPYPTMAYRPRFNTMNHLFRDLDLKFKKFPPALRHDWELFAQENQWMTLCELWNWVFDVFTVGGVTGVQAYEIVNATAYTNGALFYDAPPIGITVPDSDVVHVNLSDPYSVTWDGRSSTPLSFYVAWVAAVPLMHEPESGPTSSKYKFQYAERIIYGASFPVGRIFDVSPGFAFLPYTAVSVVITDKFGVPFASGQVGFSN